MESPFLALLISLVIIFAATAVGRRLLLLFRVSVGSPIESSVFGVGLGLGVLGYAILGLGLLGLLYRWVLIAVVGLALLLAGRQIIETINDIRAGLRRGICVRVGFASGLLAFSSISLAILALMQTLTPPAGFDWDGLAYHLAVPKLYLLRHTIYYVPFISHSNFPFLTEMWYTLGLSLGSAIIAKLFHFFMYVGTALGVYSLCREHINRTVGSVAAVIFMSIPVVFWEAGVAYADITTAFYLVLAVYATLNWEKSDALSWLFISSLAAGFALGTKVLAAVPIAVTCLYVLIVSARTHGLMGGTRLALLYGLLAFAVGSPWYIKSYVYTGNPVYPFLFDIFGGKYWSHAAAEAYRGAQLEFGVGRGLKQFIMLPWNLTLRGYEFFDSQQFIGLIGVAFLGLIPLHILMSKRVRAFALLGSISFVFVLAWFFLMQQSRYLIGIFPMLAVIAATAVHTANEEWPIARHAVNLFVVVAVGATMIVGGLLAKYTAPFVFGQETSDEYLTSTLDVYAPEAWINEFTPPDAGVVLFDEVRGFYLGRRYIWGNPGHHEIIPWESFKQAADMVNWLRAHGYTYAVVNWRFAEAAYQGVDDKNRPYDVLHSRLLPNAIGSGLMREVFAWHSVSVYEFAKL